MSGQLPVGMPLPFQIDLFAYNITWRICEHTLPHEKSIHRMGQRRRSRGRTGQGRGRWRSPEGRHCQKRQRGLEATLW